jgi:tetratricopeptide (TPR) repeat protein
VLGTQAHLCLVQGDPETALGLFRESYAIAKELGDGATQARSGCGLGECYTRLGQIDQARQALHEAIEVTRALGERGDELNAWRLLARTYDAKEDPEGLAEVLASCAVAADAEEIPLDERLRVRAELANAYVRGGRFHEAERPYREGLQLARQSASRQWEGYFAGNLGSALVEMGRPAEAGELLSLSLEVAKAEGDEEGARIAQHNLAVLEEAAAPAEPDSSAPDNEAGGS